MKHIITAAMLILATPAFAAEEKRFYGSAAAWECKGATAISNKGYLTFEVVLGSQYGEKGLPPRQGSLNWKWDMDKGEVWLNGKSCKKVN